MSEPFIAEINMFGSNFAPRGWAFCSGQLLPIAQHTALFSIIGTIYGGDGRSTLGLPDMRSRAPMHYGNGTGLTPRRIGERGGSESTTLSTNNLPAHNHTTALPANSANSTETTPDSNQPATIRVGAGPATRTANAYSTTQSGTDTAASFNLENTGGGQSFTNIQPVNTVNFIIALVGIFPSRS